MGKIILHVDINSYFATLLQQENPFLRDRPVGVVKDVGRTCIIAASKEAKKLGIKTGSNVADAKILAPDIVLVPAEFDLYLDATRKLKRIFESLAPEVSIYSLDEAFVDISSCRDLYPDPIELGYKIQKIIKQVLGDWVTCNIGISHNRFLAKLASEISPKESIFTIDKDNLDIVLAEAEFADVCGIGLRLERKLRMLNVFHPFQIRFYTDDDLLPLFGPFWSQELMKIAYGEEPYFLTLLDKNPHMKSVGRSITGRRVSCDEDSIKQVLYNLTEEVTYKVRQMDLCGRYVSIHLYGSGATWRAHRTLKYYLRHTKEMFRILYYDLYHKWKRHFPIIKFAVRLGQLVPINQTSGSLLPDWQQQERLYTAMDSISKKYGLFTVYSGLLHKKDIIRPEVTGFLGDKIYQLG